MGQSIWAGTQERVQRQGHRGGTGYRNRDTEMGQGTGTGTERGQSTGTGHGNRATEVGQTHRDGEKASGHGQRWDRVQGQEQDLQDFLLPRDLLRSLLVQGRGLAL